MCDSTELVFVSWDEDAVVDLDGSQEYPSDYSQIWGNSVYLRWGDVDMEPYKFWAPSLGRLEMALQHVTFGAACPGDI